MKKLTKSNDKKICGVCGGLAEYFGIDPTIVRLGWLLLALCGGTGILAYIIAAIVMPEGQGTNDYNNYQSVYLVNTIWISI